MCEKIKCYQLVSVGAGHSTDQDMMKNENDMATQVVGDMAEGEEYTYVHKYFMDLSQHLLDKEELLRAAVTEDIIIPAQSIGFRTMTKSVGKRF